MNASKNNIFLKLPGQEGRQLEVTTTTVPLMLTAAYEVDLWGRVSSVRKAAGLDLAATREDRDAMAMMISGQVAETWFALLEQRASKALLARQVAQGEQLLELVELRFSVGQSNAVAVLQQRQQVASLRAQQPLVEAAIATLGHQLAVLLGRAPGGDLGLKRDAALPKAPPLPATGVPADPDCVAAAEATARQCEELGHEVVEASPTTDSKWFLKAFGAVLIGYLGWAIDSWAARVGRPPSEEHFEPATWRMYQSAKRQSGGDYLAAVQEIQRVARDMAGFFTDHDLWLTPTLARPPAPLGYFGYTPETRDRHFAHLGEFTGFTLIANATGQPGVSLPLHWNDDGLPIGVHFTARYGDEATLVRLAAQLERAQPWSDRRPPVRA